MDELTVALQHRGLAVGVAVSSEPVPQGEALLMAFRRPGGWATLAKHRRELRRAAAAIAPGADLFHAHSWFPAGLAAPPDAPLVLTTYGPDVEILRESRLARQFARPIFERAAVLTAASREAADYVQQFSGRHVDREHVQMMPVDTSAWPWTTGGGGAVAIAALTPPHRLDLVIHTVSVLASCGHALPLTIIGEGPLRAELARFADLNGVETLVRFVEGASADEILRHLATADLMLHPVKGATAAPWVLGAMLMGIPVIACWDGGAAVELVPETGAGRLTLPSTEALSDAALGVLMDPDRFEAARLVGEAWRARVAPDHVAGISAEWYREAVGG